MITTLPQPMRKFTADEGARLLAPDGSVNASRFRASWKLAGIVEPLPSIDGRSQPTYAVASLVRAAIYCQLQQAFGQQSSVALELVRPISDAMALDLMREEEPVLTAVHDRRCYQIVLDPAPFRRIREAGGL